MKGSPMTPPDMSEDTGAVEMEVFGFRLSQFVMVLPMCTAEFLSWAILRSVVPKMQAEAFGVNSYSVEGATLAVQGLLSFIFCPVFGAISDFYGRCWPLAAAAAGALVPVMAVLMGYGMWHYQVLLALSGAFKATFVVVFAYVADTLPAGPRRTTAYGVVLGTLGLSLAIGPMVGGAVAGYHGNRAAFLLTAILGGSAIAYALCLLPESVHLKKRRVAVDWGNANPFRVLRWVCEDTFLKRLMTIAFLYYLSYWGLVSSAMLYVTRRFNFTPIESGQFLAWIGTCNMLSEVVVVRYMLRVGFPEQRLLQLGLAGWSVKCLLFGVAAERSLLWIAGAMSLISGLFGPALTALAAHGAEFHGKQGEVQGAVAAFRALAEGTGPFLNGLLLVYAEGSLLPGAPYIAASALSVLSLTLAFSLPPVTTTSADRSGTPVINSDCL
eukprot:Sspe_Gene.108213::Locus_87381_Transcript_1_1_Confidence_1.000_Length_1473::g.108213::m.108213